MTRLRPWQIFVRAFTVVLAVLVGPVSVSAAPRARDIFLNAGAAELAEAAGREDRKAVIASLAKGQSLAVRGDRDVTLLQWMLLNRNLKGLKTLLDAGADPAQPGLDGDTVMHLAAAANDPAYLSELLVRGIGPDLPNAKTGRTPLMAAIIGERGRQFDMLIKAGANPGHVDYMGNTPLHIAAQVNEPVRVLALLEAGAPPNARNKQGETFQRYLTMGDPKLLNWETREAGHAISAWLILHKVPIEIRLPSR